LTILNCKAGGATALGEERERGEQSDSEWELKLGEKMGKCPREREKWRKKEKGGSSKTSTIL